MPISHTHTHTSTQLTFRMRECVNQLLSSRRQGLWKENLTQPKMQNASFQLGAIERIFKLVENDVALNKKNRKNDKELLYHSQYPLPFFLSFFRPLPFFLSFFLSFFFFFFLKKMKLCIFSFSPTSWRMQGNNANDGLRRILRIHSL